MSAPAELYSSASSRKADSTRVTAGRIHFNRHRPQNHTWGGKKKTVGIPRPRTHRAKNRFKVSLSTKTTTSGGSRLISPVSPLHTRASDLNACSESGGPTIETPSLSTATSIPAWRITHPPAPTILI